MINKIRTNKWYFIFSLRSSLEWDRAFVFELGVYKIIQMPQIGYTLAKHHYKGFKIFKILRVKGFNLNNYRG